MASEQDIEILEQYLDGELSQDQKAALTQRLESDQALSAELSSLKSAREARMQIWASLEGDEQVADRVLQGLKKRRERRAWYMVLLDHRERIAAAAACVAVFMIGWQWGRNANAFRMTQGMPTAQPVRFIEQQQIPSGQTTVFEVRVTDEAGKVIRNERFSNLQDAQRFIEQTRKELSKQK